MERVAVDARLLIFFPLALLSFHVFPRQAIGQAPTESLDRFLKAHCSDCHNGNSKETTFSLIKLAYRSDSESLHHLTQVFERVQAAEMPPKNEAQPSLLAREEFLKNLSHLLVTLDGERIARDGRAVNRRLNRYEYENSLRDLLNLPWLQIRDTLPEDGELYRYNKVGEALDVSHVHLSRYMNAADNALKQAVSMQLARPQRTTKRYYARDELSLVSNFWPRENGTLPDRLSFPVLDSHAQPDVRCGDAPKTSSETREREAVGRVSSIFSDAGGYSWGQFRVPASGRYRLRFKGYSIWVSGGGIGRWFYEGFGKEKAPVYHLPLWHRPNADEVWPGRRSEPIGIYAQSSGKSRALGAFDFEIDPTIGEIEATLIANEVIQSDGMRLFRTRVNGTDEQYINPLATESGMPGYAIQWMEVDGPIDDEETALGYRRLFGSLPLKRLPDSAMSGLVLSVPASHATPAPPQPLPSPRNATGPPPRRGFGGPRWIDVRVDVESVEPLADAKRLIQSFLALAYDRSVGTNEVDRFVKLFEREYAKGQGFANAMIATYTAILASPGYLYLDYSPGKLDHHAIASRLSLFLWNSKPDAELRRLADEGSLLNPEVLHRQVDRMLDDPKSRRFIEAFADYWLDLRKIDDTSPSTTLYNDYELDEPLKAAALEETRLYIAKMFQDDLPAKVIIDSDYTFVNERLATHYNLPDILGANLRLISLPKDSLRGGLLTQASILKVTANGTTTSPVIRGNWISERILGLRVSPPPAVPAVEPDIRGAVTIRQQLELHRNDPSCASCHSKIDPPGLALESFDVMGGYRERYRAIAEDQPPTNGVGMNGQRFAFHYALPVDSSGILFDGSKFDDIRDLKRHLLRDEKAIANNLACQLLIYATGAPLTVSNKHALDSILQSTASKHYGARSIIHEIVASDLFLEK